MMSNTMKNSVDKLRKMFDESRLAFARGRHKAGNHLFGRISCDFKCAIKLTNFSAELNILCTVKRANLSRQAVKFPDLNTTHIIYQFTWSCDNTCIGWTDRCLDQQTGENVLKWLVKSLTYLSGNTRIAASSTRNILRPPVTNNWPRQSIPNDPMEL